MSLPRGAGAGKSVWSSEEPLQFDFAIVLHPSKVYGYRHRAIIEEIHHLTGSTVPLDVEVVASDAQINGGFLHTHPHRLNRSFSQGEPYT